MLYLEDLSEESIQTFIFLAKAGGFSEMDIENALSSKVRDLADTFFHLNLHFDSETEETTTMDNETLTLTNIPF